jgi:hypothetical protein
MMKMIWVSPTENQSIIIEQKVRDINFTNIELDNKPPLIVVEIILPNASITMTNSEGDRWSPFLKLRELLKNHVEVLFTKVENELRKYDELFKSTIPPPPPPPPNKNTHTSLACSIESPN